MGLDTSHDCWHGPYSLFSRWREAIAKAVGIPLMQMEGYQRDRSISLSWNLFKDHPLVPLLNHSDCEGSIASADCTKIADALEALPLFPESWNAEDWREPTRRFIEGLRRAAAAGEDVEFH